jgi:predicted Zn-dependent peptidase
MIISAAGNLQHADVRDLVNRAFGELARDGESVTGLAPTVVPQLITRTKDLEQSHICLGTNGYPQNHGDRYVTYILNTVLGGSMSSRLFQNVREKRGLCYAVSASYQIVKDRASVVCYAGTTHERAQETLDVTLGERPAKTP